MANCYFCSSEVKRGRGTMYVKKDGTILNFCSSKCRKNSLRLGREGRRVKWTRSAKLFKGKA